MSTVLDSSLSANSSELAAKADNIVRLLTNHRKALVDRGLTDETIAANKICSVTDYRAAEQMLGFRYPQKNGPAICIPYADVNGDVAFRRLRPDNPPTSQGKPKKYLQPKGMPLRAYFPAGVRNSIRNIEQPLIITEGEFKAACALQHGFSCISIPGVDCWHLKKSAGLLPDLASIEWSGRKVYIAFDSDAVTNPAVLNNECMLAATLATRGAVVKIVRLPPLSDGAKVGLDDFLAANGASVLAKLLEVAEDPEPVAPGELKSPAGELDPGNEARAFLDESRLDGVYRLRHWRGSYWFWRGGAHRECESGEVRAELVRRLDRRFSKLGTSSVASVLEIVKAHAMLPHHVEPPTWLESDSMFGKPDEILATRSKLLHLPSFATGQVVTRDATPRFFTTAALDFDFDLGAPRPDLFLSFLGELWPDDPDVIATLQEWLGYLLTPDTSQQKILLVVGPKRAGKGVIGRLIRELVGRANVTGPTLASLAGQFGLWPLVGKSVALIADARLGSRTDQSTVVERLLSISGEDALTCDRKFQEPVTGKLPTRITIFSNELPRLLDASGALSSRFIVLRLNESFYGREDTSLTTRLLSELPGILLWAIAGWQRLQERGHFVQPNSGVELLEDLHDLVSPVGQFVRERCEVGLHYRASAADLFEEWKSWCEAAGRKGAGTIQNFGRELSAAVPRMRRVKTQVGTDRHWVYDGIGLKQSW
jgi:putative DNA primase/helicase